jgi:hypothetical protein
MSANYTQYEAVLGLGNLLTLGIATGESGRVTDPAAVGCSNILGDIPTDTFAFGEKTYNFAGTIALNLLGGGTTQAFVGTVDGTDTIFAPSGLALGPTFGIVVTPPPGAAGPGEWNLTGGGVGCFLAGTHLQTPNGMRPVEALRAGDLLVTADGEAPIRRVGRSNICRLGMGPLDWLPIRLYAGALGPNCPTHDLLVSSGQGILIGGVLAHAGALVNGETIVREYDAPAIFTYYEVELDAHAVLLAEGAPVESFLAGAADFDFGTWSNRTEPARTRDLPYPRVKTARQLPPAVMQQIGRAARILVLASEMAD